MDRATERLTIDYMVESSAVRERQHGFTKDERRRRARRGEGDLLRQQILRAAERLLLQAGDQSAVSIRSIAKAVGCTPPAIYMHWGDKDQLFWELSSSRFRELNDWIDAVADSDDPLESLRQRGKAYVRFGVEHSEIYRLLMMTRSEGPIHEHDPGRSCLEHLAAAIQRCIDVGAFTDVDPRPSSLALWASLHGLTSLLITFPNFDWGAVEDLVDMTLDVQIEGLLAL